MSGIALESPDEFDRLLDDLCNKCIDDAGRNRLAEILLTSDEACQKYVEMVYLCVGISYLTGVKTQAAPICPQEYSNSAWPLPAHGSCSGDPPAKGLSSLAFAASQLFDSWVGLRKSLLAAAALAICAAVAFLVSRLTDDFPKEIAHEAVRDSTAESTAFDARTLRIDSGSARITLPKVGYMLIDGPAEVDLISPLRAKLNRGRIRVRVTELTGQGFVVETPDGDVADLSTEFGLDVAAGKKTSVVVFDGKVDLHPGKSAVLNTPGGQRLVGGEGVLFNRSGELDRIVSIVTGRVATFQPEGDTPANTPTPVIKKVTDNLPSAETKRFYEIVPGGLKEDALAYADRPEHEWNGLTEEGMPSYLIGADYVKTFCDDKFRPDMQTRVTLSRPAKLYVFYDEELKPPKWLQKGFRKIADKIGRDLGKWPTIGRPVERAVGAGNSIDHEFGIWERVVTKPSTVKLGDNGSLGLNGKQSLRPHMYGIAAVALDAERPADSSKSQASAQANEAEAK